jgi:hypothetical protein
LIYLVDKQLLARIQKTFVPLLKFSVLK